MVLYWRIMALIFHFRILVWWKLTCQKFKSWKGNCCDWETCRPQNKVNFLTVCMLMMMDFDRRMFCSHVSVNCQIAMPKQEIFQVSRWEILAVLLFTVQLSFSGLRSIKHRIISCIFTFWCMYGYFVAWASHVPFQQLLVIALRLWFLWRRRFRNNSYGGWRLACWIWVTTSIFWVSRLPFVLARGLWFFEFWMKKLQLCDESESSYT